MNNPLISDLDPTKIDSIRNAVRYIIQITHTSAPTIWHSMRRLKVSPWHSLDHILSEGGF